jgi:hypothetical protein
MRNEARHIWDQLRPNVEDNASSSTFCGALPLELSDLDEKEAANVNQFAQDVWTYFGFDLDKAWACIDPYDRRVVSLDEFVEGVKGFGFEGNAKLIFRGLDSGGLGRLSRVDFDYMNVFVKANSKVNYSSPSIRALTSWVKTQGGVDSFLDKLGFEAPAKAGTSKTEEVLRDVSDVAARLTALGYPGDAFGCAAITARSKIPPSTSHPTMLPMMQMLASQ